MTTVAYLPPTSQQTSFQCGFASHPEQDLVLDADTQGRVADHSQFHPTKTWVAEQTKDIIHCGVPTKQIPPLSTDYDDSKARKSPSWESTDSSDDSDDETLSEGEVSDEDDQPSPLPPPLYGKAQRYNRPVKENRAPSPPPSCLPDTRPLHRLRIDNSFLVSQNHSLTREIQHSRYTIQALKTIVQHKEDEATQLQNDLSCAYWRIQVLETMLMRCIGPEEEDESDEKREIRAAWECYESRFLGGWNEEGSKVQESESESEDLEEEEEEDADVNLDVDVESNGEGQELTEEEEEEEEEEEFEFDDEDSFSFHSHYPEESNVNRSQFLDNSRPFVPQTKSLTQTSTIQQSTPINNSATRNLDAGGWNSGEKVGN